MDDSDSSKSAKRASRTPYRHRFCAECGREIRNEAAAFCGGCGSRLRHDSLDSQIGTVEKTSTADFRETDHQSSWCEGTILSRQWWKQANVSQRLKVIGLSSLALLFGLAILGNLVSDDTAPDSNTTSKPNSATNTLQRATPMRVEPAPQQKALDARLALCIVARDGYPYALRGESHKNTIQMASHFAIGERAGVQSILHAYFTYERGEWSESDCYALSTARWAIDEGYLGSPIQLPVGAIRRVVNSNG